MQQFYCSCNIVCADNFGDETDACCPMPDNFGKVMFLDPADGDKGQLDILYDIIERAQPPTGAQTFSLVAVAKRGPTPI